MSAATEPTTLFRTGRSMVIAALLLGLFALLGSAMVAITEHYTAPRIAANQRAELLQSLQTLLPSGSYDNDLLADTLTVSSREWLGTEAPVTLYRARLGTTPVAVILSVVAPDGYSGDIHLLVAIYADGRIAGVRVVAHQETPGLGDRIELRRSDWILGFNARSLRDPMDAGWRVKKDGGLFDQFTGATITPRAVVAAVRRTLHYFEAEREQLLAPKEVNHE